MVDFAAQRADGAWSKDMEGIHERYARTVKKLREEGRQMGLRQGRAEAAAEILAVAAETASDDG